MRLFISNIFGENMTHKMGNIFPVLGKSEAGLANFSQGSALLYSKKRTIDCLTAFNTRIALKLFTK